MIVYQATKSQFLEDAGNGIEDIIRIAIKQKMNHTIALGSSEYNSWKNSLGNHLFHVLNTDTIPNDTIVALEYGIPRSSKRIDVLLAGLNSHKKEQLLIIELKQWTEAEITTKDGVVRTSFSFGNKELSHPSYQAWSYASLLENFNERVFSQDVDLHPCGYIHNHVDNNTLSNDFYKIYLDRAPLFYKGQKNELQQFITRFINQAPHANLLSDIDAGAIRPSKDLADSIASMMKGNQEFILIDEQKVIYESLMEAIRNSAKSEKKQVFIVDGGPGTGKTVVAVNTVAQAIIEQINGVYATKNAAPRVVMRERLTGTMPKSRIDALFISSGAFIHSKNNEYDVICADEAHRLVKKSGIFKNLGEDQIKEIVHAGKVSIFFIDERQQVTYEDHGSKAMITKWAEHFDADITELKLESQFRCNGSDGFLAWVDNTLQIDQTANFTLEEIQYDFKVFDNPTEMFKAVKERNTNNKARMVAGYCWDWVSKKDPSAFDIEFEEFDFHMQWNLNSDGGRYLIAEESIEQIGCIHTCQGLDLEYVGVIIGPDLYVRDGVVYTTPQARAKSDKSLNGYKRDLKNGVAGTEKRADAVIRNTYRTLLTRGMKGCYIYCTDNETAEYFKECMG